MLQTLIGGSAPKPPPGRHVSPDPSFPARRPRHAHTTTAEHLRTAHAAVFAPVKWEVWRAEVLQRGLGQRPMAIMLTENRLESEASA
jgi:hypothetical protein